MSPQLIPVKNGTYEPVNVKLDNGEMLMAGEKPASFSRREAIRISCYPKRLAAWLKISGNSKERPAPSSPGPVAPAPSKPPGVG